MAAMRLSAYAHDGFGVQSLWRVCNAGGQSRFLDDVSGGHVRFSGGFVCFCLIKFMPSPEALANEIAWLNHGWEKPGLVPSVRQALTKPIAEVMSDWGLLPEA